MVVEWKKYIFTLHRAHGRLTHVEDELIWRGVIQWEVFTLLNLGMNP
jgi:hypothetical protein